MTGSLDLEYPELLRQWTQNFAWSMGLVEVKSWNDIINWLREKASRNEVSGQEQQQEHNSQGDNNHQQQQEQAPPFPTLLPPGKSGFKYGHRQPLSYNNTSLHEPTTGKSNNGGNNSASRLRSLLSSFSARPWMSPPTIAFLKHFRANDTGVSVHLATRQDHRQENAAGTDVNVEIAHLPGEALLPSSEDPNSLQAWPELSTAVPCANDTNRPSSRFLGGSGKQNQELQQLDTRSGPIQPSGLHSFGDRLHIPARNMFMTSLFALLTVIVILSLVAIVARASLEVYAFYRPRKFTKLRRRFLTYYAGHLLRVTLLGFFAVSTLAFYQLTLDDAWPMMSLATLTLFVLLSMVIITTVRLRRAGCTSLFVEGPLKSKYGPLYDQYMLSAYLFFAPVLVYQFSKAALVGLGQGDPYEDNRRHGTIHLIDDGRSAPSAWVQTLLMLLLEVAFAGLLLWRRPYADVTPNRLNAVLGVLRVVNIMLLTVLLEGASSSAVSRATVGVAITVLQALILAVLAILVIYQLGKTAWRLRKALQLVSKNAKKESALSMDRRPKYLLEDGEEVLVVSVKDDENNDDEGVRFGRNAMDLPRLNDASFSNSSISTLVGRMSIGALPSIEYRSPANSVANLSYLENSHYHQASPCRPRPKIFVSSSDRSPEATLSRTDSTSSHILDYYSPAYLPSSLREKHLASQAMLQPGLDGTLRSKEHVTTGSTLAVPLQMDVPWVQSAYMTRRKSESNVPPPHPFTQDEPKGPLGPSGISLLNIALASEENDDHDEQLSQRRWRPRSLGGSMLMRTLANVSSGSLPPPPIQCDFMNLIPSTLQGPPPSPPREVSSCILPIMAALSSMAATAGPGSPTSAAIDNDRDTTQPVHHPDEYGYSDDKALAGDNSDNDGNKHKGEEREDKEEEGEEVGEEEEKGDEEEEEEEDSPHPYPPLPVRIAALMAYCFPDETSRSTQPSLVPHSPCPYVLTPIHPLSPMFHPGSSFYPASSTWHSYDLSRPSPNGCPCVLPPPGSQGHHHHYHRRRRPSSLSFATPSPRFKPALRIDTKTPPPPSKKRPLSLFYKTTAGSIDTMMATTTTAFAPAPVPVRPPQIPLPALPCSGLSNSSISNSVNSSVSSSNGRSVSSKGSQSSMSSDSDVKLDSTSSCTMDALPMPSSPSWSSPSSSSFASSLASLPRSMTDPMPRRPSGPMMAGGGSNSDSSPSASSNTIVSDALPATTTTMTAASRHSISNEVFAQIDQHERKQQQRQQKQQQRPPPSPLPPPLAQQQQQQQSRDVSMSPPARPKPAAMAKAMPFSPAKRPQYHYPLLG
ncbi:hypothetical protein DFQ26_002745 [Actinomortierella ambigua]|nr:hypothetical protein DFQ26_002745 [Actinomortierella ambigua]